MSAIIILLVGIITMLALCVFRISNAWPSKNSLVTSRGRWVSRMAMKAAPSSSSPPHDSNKVIILAGATSSGKSAVSMELARIMDIEIIIADSVQVYRGLDIGSNKPSREDQSTIPHHLIDIAEAYETLNTADYARQAADVIRGVLARRRTPVVVGGSTMWIQWLTKGISDNPKASEYAVNKANELINHLETSNNWDEALAMVTTYGSKERIEKLSRNDWYRLRRYLEISIDNLGSESLGEDSGIDSGKKGWTGQRTPLLADLDLRCFFLVESREALYHTIDHRCELMLKAGFIKEVGELLLQEKLQPEYIVSKSIGYRQMIEYFIRQPNDPKSFQDFLR